MANIIQNIVGMGDLTEQVIATGIQFNAKAAIKCYANALAEATSPEVRSVLRRQMDIAIDSHEKITNYMLKKEYYNAYNPSELIKADIKNADSALELHI